MAEMEDAEVGAQDALDQVAGGTLLVDVREPAEWERGHSPLAVLFPMSQFAERIDELPRDAPILVVCHSGRRSASVVTALRDAGYSALSVSGGMIAVLAAGGALVADGPDAPRVD